MREKWRELSLFQRVLLVILAAMILGFGVATPIMSIRKGIEYRDTLLYFTQEGRSAAMQAGWTASGRSLPSRQAGRWSTVGGGGLRPLPGGGGPFRCPQILHNRSGDLPGRKCSSEAGLWTEGGPPCTARTENLSSS